MLHNHTSLMPPPLNLHQTTMDSTITPLSTIAFPRLTSPHFTSTIIASMPKCHLSPCITAFSINPHPFMPRTTAARHCSLHSQPQHALPPQSLLSFLRLTTTHQPTWLYHEAVKCRLVDSCCHKQSAGDPVNHHRHVPLSMFHLCNFGSNGRALLPPITITATYTLWSPFRCCSTYCVASPPSLVLMPPSLPDKHH